MPQTAGFVEGLDVNRVIRITVKLEQRLVNALHEADDVVLFVGFLENAHANTAQLGPALHQGLVPEQDGLPVHARVVQQHRVDGTRPFNGFLKQGDGDINPFVLEPLCNFHRTIVQALKIPGNERDLVGFTEIGGPLGGDHDVAAIKLLGGLDRIETPAQQCDIALVRVFGRFRSAHRIQCRIGPA